MRVTASGIFVCIFAIFIMLYSYIDNLNSLTELKLKIPSVEKELNRINDDNIQLQYQINQFESPENLMELAKKPEFGHLKFPSIDKVVILKDNL